MNEIYWLTRLDAIEVLLKATLCGVLVVGMIIFIISLADSDSDFFKRWAKRLWIPFAVSILGLIFVPTTNDALMIYGIGGIVDCVKGNDKAKQIPDKCLEALNEWIEQHVDNENDGTLGQRTNDLTF